MPAGMNRTWSSASRSATARAATMCPVCTGSKDPPNTPMRTTSAIRGSRRGRGRTDRGKAAGAWEVLPQIRARLIRLVIVSDVPVGIHQPHQRVRGVGRPCVAREHLLEVQNGWIVRLEAEVELARPE